MTETVNVGESLNIDLSDWAPSYNKLAAAASRNRVFVGDAGVVGRLIDELVPFLRMRKEVIATVLKLEYGYPERKTYKSAATRDDGSKMYRGITQASQPFWSDVVSHAARKGFLIEAQVPESASLFEQIAAPFIYLDRYRNDVKDHLFTPAMIYALHQQGPGAARKKFATIAGAQSGQAVEVVKIAQLGAQGQAKDFWL